MREQLNTVGGASGRFMTSAVGDVVVSLQMRCGVIVEVRLTFGLVELEGIGCTEARDVC